MTEESAAQMFLVPKNHVVRTAAQLQFKNLVGSPLRRIL